MVKIKIQNKQNYFSCLRDTPFSSLQKMGSTPIDNLNARPYKAKFVFKSTSHGSCFSSASIQLIPRPDHQLALSQKVIVNGYDSLTHISQGVASYVPENHLLVKHLRDNIWNRLTNSILTNDCVTEVHNQNIKIEQYQNNTLIKTSQYFYDALGRRFKKKITDHQNLNSSFERKFIYDGQEILAELDGDNNTLGVYTHSTLRTDDVLAVDVQDTKLANQTGSYFYLKDGLGSIIDITDSSGNIVQHYAYSAFGKILKISDNLGNDITANPLVKTSYGFTNREHDTESGMMYYRARYMIPEIGRFIQEDEHPGDRKLPLTFITQYVYVLNNPANNLDPSGLQSIHGGYCGPFARRGDDGSDYGNATGRYNEYGEFIDDVPRDDLDQACYEHDAAYNFNAFFSQNPVLAKRQYDADLKLRDEGFKYAFEQDIIKNPGNFFKGVFIGVFGNIFADFSRAKYVTGEIFKAIGITL